MERSRTGVRGVMQSMTFALFQAKVYLMEKRTCEEENAVRVRASDPRKRGLAGAEERSLDAYPYEVDMNDAAYCCSSCDFLTS
uniref:Uncharacterized protein n=1 Tax=Ascaris lumbricoides TaxID=6252 RepID=A0A0M3HS37_ASCLU